MYTNNWTCVNESFTVRPEFIGSYSGKNLSKDSYTTTMPEESAQLPVKEQWEYQSAQATNPKTLTSVMNDEGKEGWEAFAVACDGIFYNVFLKRRKK